MIGDRRVQFIPVLWRAAVKAAQDENDSHAEDDFPPLELDDIFGDRNSIPLIRQIISGVLVEIPLYMSADHHSQMLRCVIAEMNRLYALFRQRNPRRTGPVTINIIGHSLGSALAVDVLSRQPSRFNGEKSDDHLNFDTKRLYTCGSPAALFLWMKRKTLAGRGEDAKPRFGSLAVEQVWNAFYKTDPVATRLNSCVHPAGKTFAAVRTSELVEALLKQYTEDVGHGPSSSSKSFMLPFLSRFSGGSGSTSKPAGSAADPEEPSANTSLGEDANALAQTAAAAAAVAAEDEEEAKAAETGESADDSAVGAGTVAEKATSQDERELRDARHHFTALNPIGSVDYRLPTAHASALLANQYFDSVFAHGAYWADANYALFVLTTTFAKEEDFHQPRTGLNSSMWK